MAFAGIWEQWKVPGGEEVVENFSILTTNSNELIAPLHDRMPVILQEADYGLWLNKELQNPAELQRLYRPIIPDRLEMHRVTDRMNSPKFTGPECVQRI